MFGAFFIESLGIEFMAGAEALSVTSRTGGAKASFRWAHLVSAKVSHGPKQLGYHETAGRGFDSLPPKQGGGSVVEQRCRKAYPIATLVRA
jgi:hypothetical protein